MVTILLATMLSGQLSGLRADADRIKFSVGTCVAAELLQRNADEGRYEKAILANVNMIEPENDLKPAALWKGIGQYDFARADFLLGAPGKKGWAQNHKMLVRGHVLLYPADQGYTTPKWLQDMEKNLTPEQTKQILKDYIYTVAGRYKGKIVAWDVVNEALSDGTTKNPYNLRDCFWFRKLGLDYLVLAFKYAHEADPKAKLYYNDYNVEHGARKGDDMIAMCNYLRSKGAQIDGIGLQYHSGPWANIVPGSAQYKFVEKIEANNYDWMITELDYGIDVKQFPRTDANYGTVPNEVIDYDRQAVSLADTFRMALESKRCKAVQMWGITDRHSWIPGQTQGKKGCALILNADYVAKPALGKIQAVIASAKPRK